jgi:ABC-type branched-subunit amino acid transport system permease subunit
MRTAMTRFGGGLLILLVLAALGWVLPNWCVFLLVTAFAKGLTALGLVILLRSGLLSFGQGLFYCAGGYGAGLLALWGNVRDVSLLVAAGGFLGAALGFVVGPLLARYRGIFFATLTLALSMLFYGILAKTDVLGGTDGLNLPRPSFFGYTPQSSEQMVRALYLYSSVLVVLIGVGCRIHFNSIRGLLSIAAHDNEIRVEYLGMSVSRIVVENIVASAVLGGIGGALNAIAIAHIDPDLAFWTTSGELTFVAVLSGPFSVPAAFVSSILIEFTRSLSGLYFPDEWQMSLGLFMLFSILFLPAGIGSLFRRYKKSPSVGIGA